jgi:hypothetical protein
VPPSGLPPAGRLVGDDGTQVVLDTSYVIGRDPSAAPQVQHGLAQPLALSEEDGAVSRVHARIEVDGGEVNVVDASSTNGTYVALAGSAEWIRLAPERPALLTPGTHVLIGYRTYTFEAPPPSAPPPSGPPLASPPPGAPPGGF